MSKGIDVSKWQGVIDWNKVKKDGIDFAIIRAGYGWGSNQKDPKFEYNYENAKKAGIKVGAYHYSYATSVKDAIKEAEFFYSIIKGKTFEYPVIYDMEEKRISDLGKTKVSEIAKAFCNKMEELGYYVSIYANKHWLDNYFTDEVLGRFDVWLAQWTQKPSYTRNYGMWQYTSKGVVGGISTNVDMDESYKDYENIMKVNGLNGFAASGNYKPDPTPVVPDESFDAGRAITLNNAPLYVSATSSSPSNYISGSYYLYDGEKISGRYRVTSSKKYVGKTPIGNYVTGFVNEKDINLA